jgi:protein-glutamine gamma-glutamyltransferase
VDGGFTLKTGVRPSEAIDDIFVNTRLYGTECATAIVIIYYKAVLDSYKADLFNKAFGEIVLMNWRDMDDLLGVSTYRRLPDYVPGDCRYVKNPDVNPLTPEWQGENIIDLGSGRYYGHGIGTGDVEYFIRALNQNRIAGSQVSAYLMDSATRPDFHGLYRYWKFAS